MNERQLNFIKLAQEATGLPVVAEYQFHPKRKWRFDYAIPAVKIAIEVEGGVFTGGRHVTGRGFINDMEKYNTAESMGWHVLRITPDVLCAPVTMTLIKITMTETLKKYVVEEWPKPIETR